eukprot:scaffold12809_cov84-Cylindrotheca_fusiformis.AAC.1
MSELLDHAVRISAMDWGKGIGLSLLASIIAGCSKLAIRKSWLIQAERKEQAGAQEQQQRSSEDVETEIDDYTQDNESFFRSELSDDESSSGNENLTLIRPDSTQTKHDQSCCSSLIRNPYALRYSGMFGMTILNPVCSVFAMNYASPSILAPLGGLTLVWVILFSGMTVGETPTSSEMLAALLIMVGEVIVAVFGDHTNANGMTVDDVRKSYTSPATITYFACLTAYMLLLWYWMAGSKNTTLQRFAWGSSGGAITGPQNFLKDSLIVLKAVTSTPGEYIPWFFPVLILLAIGTAFAGLILLTACMKRYDATYSAAAFVGSFVVSASINAAMHYHTFSSLPSTWNDVLYPLGLVVLIFGVFLLETVGSPHDSSTAAAAAVAIDDSDSEEELDEDDRRRCRGNNNTESVEDDDMEDEEQQAL